MKKKKNKHQENAEQPEERKPVLTVKVDVFEDGFVKVRDFPGNSMEQSIQILSAGIIAIARHFRKQSDDKNLGRIIQPNKQQVAQAKKAFLQ